MIFMKIFITIIIALGFYTPLAVFVDEKTDGSKTVAALIVFSLYVTAIAFTWML